MLYRYYQLSNLDQLSKPLRCHICILVCREIAFEHRPWLAFRSRGSVAFSMSVQYFPFWRLIFISSSITFSNFALTVVHGHEGRCFRWYFFPFSLSFMLIYLLTFPILNVLGSVCLVIFVDISGIAKYMSWELI